jgi:hypothetical protein
MKSSGVDHPIGLVAHRHVDRDKVRARIYFIQFHQFDLQRLGA